MNQAARSAPAAARNREPILQVLRDILPPSALVLEIASGTGEHAVWFSRALPALTWQPTDQDPDALRASRHGATSAACQISCRRCIWMPRPRPGRSPEADAVIAINMVHIAPWSATQGLIAGAARILSAGGLLFLYGPFQEGGVHTGAGNAAFDASLRAQNPSWGIRDLDDITALARQHGLPPPERIAMPANNLSVVFRRL